MYGHGKNGQTVFCRRFAGRCDLTRSLGRPPWDSARMYSRMFFSADRLSTAHALSFRRNQFRRPSLSIRITMPSVTQTMSQASGTEMYREQTRSNSSGE